MEKLQKLANKFLVWPTVVLAILFAAEKINWLTSDELYLPRALLIILFCVGIVFYIFIGAASAFGSAEYSFSIYRMRPNEMDFAISLSKKLFPSIPTKREIKAIYGANNSICRLQRRNIAFLGARIEKHTGLCTIMPMTEEAKSLLKKEEIHGLKFTPEHIVGRHKDYSCVYIGSVGAIGPRAKHNISSYLSGFIESEFARGVEVIFTRPTTKDGLRVAKKFGFSPVSDDVGENELERVYMLTRGEYNSSNS